LLIRSLRIEGTKHPFDWLRFSTVVIAALFFSAVKISAEEPDCIPGRISLALGEETFCIPQDVPFIVVPDGEGKPFSVAIKDFDAVSQRTPFGTHDVRLTARPFVPLNAERLTYSERPSMRAVQEGRLTYLQPDDLTLFEVPFFMRCRPALSPRLSEQGAETCSLSARIGENLTVNVRLTTDIWQDKPGWPALDARFTDTWPLPLSPLEQALTAFFLSNLKE